MASPLLRILKLVSGMFRTGTEGVVEARNLSRFPASSSSAAAGAEDMTFTSAAVEASEGLEEVEEESSESARPSASTEATAAAAAAAALRLGEGDGEREGDVGGRRLCRPCCWCCWVWRRWGG